MVKHQVHYSVSIDVARILSKYASIQGMDVSRLYQQAGMDKNALEYPSGRMPIERFTALWEEIVRQSRDPDFGLHFGESVPNFSSGQIVFAMMLSCKTLQEAIDVFCRYHALLGNIGVPRWEDDRHQIAFVNHYPSVVSRHYAESLLAMFSVTLDRLTENQVKPKEIYFVHPRPIDTSEHQRIFGKIPRFGHPFDGLAVDARFLDAPILLANPTLLSALEQLAHTLLGENISLPSWSNRCSESISKLLLRSQKPTLTAVARELSVSSRHLQSKLQKESVSYQVLLDQTRKNMALNCLKQNNMTLCEIALVLGLSEQSAFNHAFKRWTGMTPTEYGSDVRGGLK
jgi:AraC-like DNA-binding protein